MADLATLQAANTAIKDELASLRQTIIDENVEVQAKLDVHVQQITALNATIVDLNAQLAGGGTVSTVALDSLLSDAQSILATAQALRVGVQGISDPTPPVV